MTTESQKRQRNMDDVDEAVKFLSSLASSNERVKVRGNINLQLSLDTIIEHSKSRGLTPENINKLVDVAASGNLPETVRVKLIKSMIPATVVPEKAVINVISHMCTNIPSSNIQCFFLRWILLVYEHIDKTEKLQNLYGIIFYFLESQTLLPHVCHLLYLLTKKEHVKMFRVRKLLMLQTKMGSQPYLTGLLAVYKLYYPSFVAVVIPSRKRLFFPSRDYQWAAAIRKVREQNHENLLNCSRLSQSLAEESLQRAEPRSKRRKIDPIPKVHSNASRETGVPREAILSTLEHGKVPFVQIGDFKAMLENFSRIEFPSQIAAVLRNNVLQHVMSYTRDQVAASRFSYWLHATLCEEILDNPPSTDDSQRIKEFLTKLVNFTDFLQEGVPVLEHFLCNFLNSWDGLDFKTEILHLITRYPLCSFDKLTGRVLEPLRKLFLCSSVYFKCQVIHCLTALLQNYAGCEWPRYMEWCEVQNETDEEQPCFSMMFQEEQDEFDPKSTITDLVEYVCKLCLIGLQLENNHNLLLHCALNFYEEVSSLHTRYQLPFTCLINPATSVMPFFCQNAIGISRICSVLCNYKNDFKSLKEKKEAGELSVSQSDGTQRTGEVNMMILDINTALWKNQLYSIKHQSHFFNFDLKSSVPSTRLAEEIFSVYMHPGIIGYTLKFLQETQPEGNRGHPKGVKPVKKEFLKFLERENIVGVSDFIQTFVKMKQSKKDTTQMSVM